MVYHPERWKSRHAFRFLYVPSLYMILFRTLTKYSLDFYGTIVGAPVFPVMLTVLWPKLNRPAIFIGSIGGTSLAIMSWLLVSRYYYGSLTLENLSSSYSSLTGSMVSLFGGGLITVVISLIKPDNYDFSDTRKSMYVFS